MRNGLILNKELNIQKINISYLGAGIARRCTLHLQVVVWACSDLLNL